MDIWACLLEGSSLHFVDQKARLMWFCLSLSFQFSHFGLLYVIHLTSIENLSGIFFFFLVFEIKFIYMLWGEGHCTCHDVHVESENNLWGVDLSFYHAHSGSRNRSHAVWQELCRLDHLSSPIRFVISFHYL